MASITLRLVKGSSLTNEETDDNFSELNTEKIERNGTIPMSGKLTLVASSTDRASVFATSSSVTPLRFLSGRRSTMNSWATRPFSPR